MNQPELNPSLSLNGDDNEIENESLIEIRRSTNTRNMKHENDGIDNRTIIENISLGRTKRFDNYLNYSQSLLNIHEIGYLIRAKYKYTRRT